MNFADQMNRAWTSHDSMLCVGLDPDPDKLPLHLRGRPRSIFEFCTAIVDATADLVCAFKPQIAYFGSARAEDQLEELIAYIHERWPQVPVILDAKRGDIGSTAEHYARESFERYKADAVTLSPYMGRDSIEPYLAYDGRGLVLLCRTSNPGGSDLQMQALSDGSLLYEHVARLASGAWGAPGRIGLVVGATYPAQLARVRSLAPDLPLLVPGIGAQGGDLEASVAAGLASGGYGMIVSSSRAILYASQGEDFAQAARQVAKVTLDAMRLAATRTRTRA